MFKAIVLVVGWLGRRWARDLAGDTSFSVTAADVDGRRFVTSGGQGKHRDDAGGPVEIRRT